MEERITKKLLALILLSPFIGIYAQDTQGGEIMQNNSETVPNAYFPFAHYLGRRKEQAEINIYCEYSSNTFWYHKRQQPYTGVELPN